MSFYLNFVCVFCLSLTSACAENLTNGVTKTAKELMVFTVASDESHDGFQRYLHSANVYGYNVQVLGLGAEWLGGDVANTVGGGYKINLLKEALAPYKESGDTVVMFTDSYDVVLTRGPEAVLNAFYHLDANVIFSSEGYCWPDPNLADLYPHVKPYEKRFLNSGGFVGYASEVYAVVTHAPVANTDDDQLYYSKIFLDDTLRGHFRMKLDTKQEIFQNLNGAMDEVRLKYLGSSSYLYNKVSSGQPAVIHGNGPVKVDFNRLANYLSDQWTPTDGCRVCREGTISLKGVELDDLPTVMLAIFIEQPTPFIEEFFQHVLAFTYPKQRIRLLIYHAHHFHDVHVQGFVASHGANYMSSEVIGPHDSPSKGHAHNTALERCNQSRAQYFFSLNGEAHLENPDVLQLLIESNRSVVVPMVGRPGKMWSNFWGALSHDGYYKRAEDYVEILHREHLGLWNVPYISSAYLIHAWRLPQIFGAYINNDMDLDMAFCQHLRRIGVFMYVDNRVEYGHLLDPAQHPTDRLHNDMYSLFKNRLDWEQRYLHPEYEAVMSGESKMVEVCTDVYWVPFMSHVFTQHLVEELENFGQWSEGKNVDPRISGGYENVPTVDIHMNQIDFEPHWLQILQDYVKPVAEQIYTGYTSDARATMNFVVRYRPPEQDRLRPHHDASTYTINVALNDYGVDYEGGGARFLRYNCSVTATRRGWMLMHPGRLTHIHEGLPTTRGTRYIMISFIDP